MEWMSTMLPTAMPALYISPHTYISFSSSHKDPTQVINGDMLKH